MSLIEVVRKLVDISPLSEADRQGLHDALDAEQADQAAPSVPAQDQPAPAEPAAEQASDATAPADQPAEPVNPSPAPEPQGQSWDTTSVSSPPPSFDPNAPT